MSLRFFTDHCISNYIVKRLREAGHEVFCLRDHIPIDSTDTIVISKAQELDSILLSLNGDFSDLVTYHPSEYKGIIALQVRNHPKIVGSAPNLLIYRKIVRTNLRYIVK